VSSEGRVLVLLRHAHAAPGSPDKARPLTPEGHQTATRMGRSLARHAVLPDVVLCSPATRARETWAGASAELEAPTPRFEDALYLASTSTLLDVIRATPSEVRVLVVVGHNPDLSVLVQGLCASRTPGLSPGDGVILESAAPTWAGAVNGTLRLVARIP